MIELNEAKELYSEALIAEGFDEAIIGVASRVGSSDVFVYDESKVIAILLQDMPYDEAVEHFEFNIKGAYMGENTPMFMCPVYGGD